MSVIRKSVYVETTVPSFYYTLHNDPESIARMHWTRQWWDEYADVFALTTSAAVIDELRRGTSEETEKRILLLENATVLPVSDDVLRVAQAYVERKVMPRDPNADGFHLR